MTEVRLVEQPKRDLRKLTGPSNKIKLNLDRISRSNWNDQKRYVPIQTRSQKYETICKVT